MARISLAATRINCRKTVGLSVFFVLLVMTYLTQRFSVKNIDLSASKLKQLVAETKIGVFEPQKQIVIQDEKVTFEKPVEKKEPDSKKKLILFYTTLWSKELWNGFETTYKFNNWGGHPCKIQDCEITHDRNLAHKADVILFHGTGRDMVTQLELKVLSKFRNPKQVWIYFIHECPYNANPHPVFFNGYFNWTMNYMTHSDIVVPYNWEMGTWKKKDNQSGSSTVVNYAKGKDRLVFAVVNLCGLLHEKYIKKLQDYVSVDVYGRCSSRFHKKALNVNIFSEEFQKLKKQYKFYLSFENSFCEDYISEKFYGTIIEGNSVPVVLGGADYKKLVIPNSYINSLDFPTIKDLADHLKHLDQNDEEYNRYQNWREHFVLGQPQAWSCEICRMINEKKVLHKVYNNLGDWYGAEKNCGMNVKLFKSILQRSNVKGPYRDYFIAG